jgi:glycosyltransferase involved in cell wall biosynthesis
MPRILIINQYFKIGGIETFLLRLISILKRQGVDVTVVLIKDEYEAGLLSQLKEMADVYTLSELIPLTSSKILSVLGAKFDWIFSTSSHSLILSAYMVGHRIYPDAHICCGVYQTEMFCGMPSWKRPQYRLVRNIFANHVPHQNILFCNEAGRKHHERNLATSFQTSTIANLIVDIEKYYPPVRDEINRNKIVSVGRICDYKTYNFTMLDVLSDLNSRGLFFHYHIHGDGELRVMLENILQERKLTDQVTIHGEFPYDQFKEKVRDAFIFVGGGTSLIEAAACGVPALTTIEYSDVADSYGFIHEVPGTSLIEPDLPYPRFNIADKIEWLAALNVDMYQSISEMGMQKVLCYSANRSADYYIDYFNKTTNIKSALPIHLIDLYLKMYCRLAL